MLNKKNTIFYVELILFISYNSASTHVTKKPIIFNLTGVLVKENKTGFTKKLGYGTLANYTLTHWKNPATTCLKMLNDISTTHEKQKPVVHIKLQEYIMPQCIVELNKGTKQCSCVKNELLACIELLDNNNYFASKKEKKLMHDMISLLFNPQETEHLIEPIKKMTILAKKLKDAGHPLYLFANIPPELYEVLKTKHADILNLFSETIISYKVNMILPEEKMFIYLFKQHNLDPHNCILINEQKETCLVAEKFGMKTIHYDKPSTVMHTLKKCGISLN